MRTTPGLASATLLAAVVLAAAPCAAQAEAVSFTVKGTIAEGVDGMGMFGLTGASLAGKTYSMTLTLDSDALAVMSGADSIAAYSQPGVPADMGGVLTVGNDHAYGWGLSVASLAYMSLGPGNRAAMGGYGDMGDYRIRAVNDVIAATPGHSYFDRLDFDQVIEFKDYPVSNHVGTDFSLTYMAPVPPGGSEPRVTLTTWFVGTDTYALWGVSPVPEPGQYGMLAAGVAVLAGIARRRARGRA